MSPWREVYRDRSGWFISLLDGLLESGVFLLGLLLLVSGLVSLVTKGLDLKLVGGAAAGAFLMYLGWSSLRMQWQQVFGTPLVVEGPAVDVRQAETSTAKGARTFITRFTVNGEAFSVPARKLSTTALARRELRVEYFPLSRAVKCVQAR